MALSPMRDMFPEVELARRQMDALQRDAASTTRLTKIIVVLAVGLVIMTAALLWLEISRR